MPGGVVVGKVSWVGGIEEEVRVRGVKSKSSCRFQLGQPSTSASKK